MATIEPYQTKSGRRWRVRYRKPDHSQTDKRGFTTKRDAALFAATVETRKAEGAYIDPTAGRVTIGDLGTKWLARQTHLKHSTLTAVKGAWRTHVEPSWGGVAVSTVARTDLADWVAELSGRRSATVVLRAHGIIRGILQDAVDDGRIPKNPAVALPNLPRKGRKPHVYLTHQQVEALAREASQYGTVILVACYLGLRWGEIMGLRVRDVNLAGRRLMVEQNAVRVGSKIHVGTPKSHERRTVPLPRFLAPLIEDACTDKLPDALLFTGPDGGFLPRAKKQVGWFRIALEGAGVDPAMTPHDMRHTAASLAVQAGAHVKAVQRMLGHASAAMTLDVYADLFDTDLDAVAEAMDAARSAAA